MKLVVKLPKDKLPFVGIEFPYTYEAGKTNQDLVLNYKQALYKIVFEFVKDKIDLKLISAENMITRVYKGLEYDKEKLKTWLYLTRDAKAFNFSHTVKEGNKELVVKTIQQPQYFILKLNKYEILNVDFN